MVSKNEDKQYEQNPWNEKLIKKKYFWLHILKLFYESQLAIRLEWKINFGGGR